MKALVKTLTPPDILDDFAACVYRQQYIFVQRLRRKMLFAADHHPFGGDLLLVRRRLHSYVLMPVIR